ncbi:MAG: pilus assembly protein N-terminal domain-containing protein [Pseudomonadota bacterium]
MPISRSVTAAAIGALASALSAASAVASEVWLTMDYVKPYELPRDAGQIVVGNPGIADVEVQDSRHLLLYGKSPGATNMYIFDAQGDRVDNLIVRVRAVGEHVVVLQEGAAERTTLNCMTVCEPTVTVGDGQAFGLVANQLNQKFQQAIIGEQQQR